MANYTLQILHYYGESGLLATSTAPILGALVDKFDDQYANTIKIAEGDTYIPGPWLVGGADPSLNGVAGIGTTALGRPDIAILNALGTNVSALGNHEFDLGSPIFQGAIAASGTGATAWAGAQFAYITDNINVAADSSLRGLTDKSLGGTSTNNYAGLDVSAIKGKIAPYAIQTIGGEKIGYVGATTYELANKSSPNGTVTTGAATINDAIKIPELAAVIQVSINALIAAGVNKIVMVDQLDTLARDIALAPLLTGVDVIVAGGGHERLADSTDALAAFNGHDATAFPGASYPIVTAGADGKTTLIVTSDTEFSYLGRLVVTFDDAGVVQTGSLNPAINGAYAANQSTLQAAYGSTQTAAQIVATSTIGTAVNAISSAINNVIASKDGAVFGYTNVYLEGDRVFGRAQEVNLGDLTADANIFKAQQAAGSAVIMGSLKNGGGIRASVGAIDDTTFAKIAPQANLTYNKATGAISQLDIENALRFDNQLMVFDTTVTGLKNILEYGTGLAAGNGGYPQLGGFRVGFDPSRAAGDRVTSISAIDVDNNVIARLYENGQISAEAPSVLSVVVLNFTANGGDGYPIKGTTNAFNYRYLLKDGTLSAKIPDAQVATVDFTAASGFTAAGVTSTQILGEQKALQDYLQAKYYDQAHAYNIADTAQTGDTRIENLSVRYNGVFEGVNTDGTASGDALRGSAGDDTIHGGAGNDTIAGGSGQDSLDGGIGHDQLFGGNGQDVLTGGAGDDSLYGGAGNDVMVGGNGNDSYVIEDVGDSAVENLGEGNDTAFVLTNGWTAGPNIETIYLYGTATQVTGSFGADTIVANATLGSTIDGGAGNDTLYGQAGNDLLIGGAGDDIIYGGAGGDTLLGGTGNDKLVGGSGADVFLYNQNGWGYDQIFDFATAQGDKIDMRGSGAASFAALNVLSFGGSTAIIYGADRIDVVGVATLTASDFIFN